MKPIPFLFLIVPAFGMVCAQNVPYKTLSFEEVSAGRHTMNEKGIPMRVLTAIKFEPDSLLCLETPQQILCPLTQKGRTQVATLYRWDVPTHSWVKASGNLRSKVRGSHAYFVFSVQCRGLFALMQESEAKGEVFLHLPKGYTPEKLVWRQENLQMAALILPDPKTGKLRIPCGSVSALARIEGTIMDAKGQRFELHTCAGLLRRNALLPFLPAPTALKARADMLHPSTSKTKELITLK